LPGAALAVVRLACELRRLRPDVVQVHYVTVDAWGFLLLRRLLGFRVVLTAHGSDALQPRPHNARALPELLRRADAVTAVGPAVAEELSRRSGRPITTVRVVPNGIRTDAWSRPSGSTAPSNTQTVVAVGRLVPVKGHDVLLEAWAAVQRQLPQGRLVVVGDGPSRAALTGQAEALGIAGSVEWAGHQPPEQLREQLHRAAVFVLPSRSEGVPLALLEAAAAGLPSVATAVGGVPALLAQGGGLLVPPEDPEALAEALLTLLRQPEVAARCSRAAVLTASLYDVAQTAAAYEDLFHELVGGASPRRVGPG
jgi:glycosyltransferase involved in cell wall biosynthesis